MRTQEFANKGCCSSNPGTEIILHATICSALRGNNLPGTLHPGHTGLVLSTPSLWPVLRRLSMAGVQVSIGGGTWQLRPVLPAMHDLFGVITCLRLVRSRARTLNSAP